MRDKLIEWFSENVTYETTEQWGDERFADELLAFLRAEGRVEQRVRFIFKEPGYLPEPKVFTHRDEWVGANPDGAANYPWLMDNCIAWVEERVVNETEWEPISEWGSDDSS